MAANNPSRAASLGRSPRSSRAGENGCTPIDHPGPRWSHYVHKLRRAGARDRNVEERHAGPYPGRHARYVLRSEVEIVSIPMEERGMTQTPTPEIIVAEIDKSGRETIRVALGNL